MARDPYAPKKRIYQRLWFWVVVIVLLSALYRAIPDVPAEDVDEYAGNVPRSDVEYIEVTVDELAEEFHANELRAKDEYIGAYVSVTGRLRVIDDDGKYLCLYPMGYESFDNVHCILMNDGDQLARLKEYSLDDTVTVKGKITELGDFHDIKLEADCLE